MSFTSTGSGTIAYRVVIDGCPYQPVTHPTMATGSGIGSRKEGLKLGDTRFSIKADPIQCKLDVGGIEIKIVDIDQVWSGVFDLPATSTTWLTSTITDAVTTVPVASTSGFASSGYVWIDSECIQYGSVDATNFLGCTRGVLSPDTDAATYHYVTDGARLRTPAITNWPALWEGRRVVVYRYDDGDDLTGSGTQTYRGVVTTEPRFDGTTWSIGVDHMISVLEQTFGEDLSISVYPRGIHYTTEAPLQINWTQKDSNFSIFKQGGVSMSGFYETQEAFCAALETAFATSMTASGGTGTVYAVSEGPSGWHLRYTTPHTSPLDMELQIVGAVVVPGTAVMIGPPLDPPLGAKQGASGRALPGVAGDFNFMQQADGDPTGNSLGIPPTIDTDYFFYRPMNGGLASYVETPLGSVPRGCWTYNDDTDGRTIYLDGGTPLSSLVTSVMVKGTDLSGNDYTDVYEITSVDTANRAIVISAYRRAARQFTADKPPEIRLGLKLQTASAPTGASVVDMLSFVQSNSAQYVTLGMLPSLRALDYDASSWSAIFNPLPPINTQRLFSTFSPVSLADIVREELKAAGCFLSLDTLGRLIPARIRLPAQSETSAIATIDSTTFLSDKMRAQHEVSGLGQINQLVYRTGYVPSDDDFKGPVYQVRDVSAFGQSPSTRAMEVAQKSEYLWQDYVPINAAMVLSQVASPIFGALAGSYNIDTIDAAKSESVAVGSAVKFDDPYLITGTGTASGVPTGALGVLGRIGLVLGKEWGAYDPGVRFTILGTRQGIAGYAPSALVSAQTNTSGNTWSITLASTYFPSGTSAADFYAASDAVRVQKFNNASASPVTGTVVSVASNVIVVTFGAAWTPGADTWVLNVGNASTVVSTQLKFCQIADANGAIDSGGTNFSRAQVFAS